jgi:hypothetical protein
MISTPDQREQTGETSGTTLHLCMLIALYAIPIVVAVRAVADPVIDPDIWWHLRVGQWVVEHHAVPATDPFSRYGVDRPWIAYSWLYEVLVFRLYEAFGLAGIVAYRVAMSMAVVAALHRLVRRREPRFLVATALTAVAALAMAPLFSERPWLVTILFTTLTLDVLLNLRAGQASRWIWLLPFAFVLWANLHIQFVYGLLLLGLACVAPGIDALLARQRGEDVGKVVSWRVVLLTGLCLLATLANPYHGQLYRVVVEYATQSGPFHCVNELRALEFREASDWVMLLLGGAAVFALGRRRRLGSFEVLLLTCAGALAFRSRRELWFLVLAGVAILATQHRRRAAGRCRGPRGPCLGPGGPRAERHFFGPARLAAPTAKAMDRDRRGANRADWAGRLATRLVGGEHGAEGRGGVSRRGGRRRRRARLRGSAVQRFQLGRVPHLEPATIAGGAGRTNEPTRR